MLCSTALVRASVLLTARLHGGTLRRTGHHPAKDIIMKMETDYSLKGGSILMDAPVKHGMKKLVESAHDREEWRARVNELKSQVYKQ